MVAKVTPNPLTGSRNDIAASRQFVGTGTGECGGTGADGQPVLSRTGGPDRRDRHLQVKRWDGITAPGLGHHRVRRSGTGRILQSQQLVVERVLLVVVG